MGWYGKLIGAVLGAIIGRGLLGAIVGFVIGHQFDRKAGGTSRAARPGAVPSRDLQSLFFRATFQVMGHVAKADGRVTEQEIDAARAAMRRFSLTDADVQRAIDLFTEGKSPGLPARGHARGVPGRVGRPGGPAPAVRADPARGRAPGGRHQPRRRVPCSRACAARSASPPSNLPPSRPCCACAARRARRVPRRVRPRTAWRTPTRCWACAPDASDADVTLAYRRLMSQNHPDKLVANGLPQSMIEAAHERTRQILEAYEVIRKHRGMK